MPGFGQFGERDARGRVRAPAWPRAVTIASAGVLLLFAPSHRARAQVPPPTSPARAGQLTLNEVLQRSLRFNPEIAKLDATLADKLGRASEAEVKLNPTFKVTAGRTSERGAVGTELELETEQPLRPSDFGLRKTYATALRAAANLEQQADVLRVLNATANVYYRAWALQEHGALLTRARGQADDALDTIQQQLEAGQSNISQRSIFEAEVARFSAELLAVRGEQAAAQAELERAIGARSAGLQLLQTDVSAAPQHRGPWLRLRKVAPGFGESRSRSGQRPRRACGWRARMRSFRSSRPVSSRDMAAATTKPILGSRLPAAFPSGTETREP